MDLTKMDAAPFPYQLAASDLDGTLLGPHKEISAANLAAVRRLQGAGARFVLASGRRHQNSVRFQRQLGLDGLLISCAGAMVKDPQTDQTFYEKLIPADLAEQTRRRGRKVGRLHRDLLPPRPSVRRGDKPLDGRCTNRGSESRRNVIRDGLGDLKGEAALENRLVRRTVRAGNASAG